MKSNKILKLAYFYSYAVSGSFDVLDTGRTVDTICKKIKDFLNQNKNIDKIDFKMRVAKNAQDKFNKLVVPYLGMTPVDIGIIDLKSRLESDVNQDDLQFFLHDLIHEAMEQGSIEKFKKLDEAFSERENVILDEMKEDEELEEYWEESDDGEDVFTKMPEYRLDSEVYSLEDFIDEQVAEALTNKTKITENGLYKYMKTILIGIANEHFNFHWPQTESFFEDYVSDSDNVKKYLEEVLDKLKEDVDRVKNLKYKKLAEKFLHSAKRWIHDAINNFDSDRSLDQIIRPILTNTKNWIGSNFNIKEKDIFTDKFRPNPMGEKSIADLSDDFKMSILRRWALALERDVNEMISRRVGEQFEFKL